MLKSMIFCLFSLIFVTPTALAQEPAAVVEKVVAVKVQEAYHPKDHFRFEINLNPYQRGDSFELGISTPSLFKLRANSPHYWSLFATVGTNALYNSRTIEDTESKERINLEVIAGLFANANFYKDFIFQYGKVGVDMIVYDKDLKDSLGFGAFFETGFEVKSSISRLSYHVGARWRFLLPEVKSLGDGIDPFEGVSMVLGTRLYL